MSKPHRSFLLASLVPAFLLVSVFTIVQAQKSCSAGSEGDEAGLIRPPGPDRKVPVAGDKVTIDAGKEVVLDVNTPALGGVTVNGKLSFANN